RPGEQYEHGGDYYQDKGKQAVVLEYIAPEEVEEYHQEQDDEPYQKELAEDHDLNIASDTGFFFVGSPQRFNFLIGFVIDGGTLGDNQLALLHHASGGGNTGQGVLFKLIGQLLVEKYVVLYIIGNDFFEPAFFFDLLVGINHFFDVGLRAFLREHIGGVPFGGKVVGKQHKIIMLAFGLELLGGRHHAVFVDFIQQGCGDVAVEGFEFRVEGGIFPFGRQIGLHTRDLIGGGLGLKIIDRVDRLKDFFLVAIDLFLGLDDRKIIWRYQIVVHPDFTLFELKTEAGVFGKKEGDDSHTQN